MKKFAIGFFALIFTGIVFQSVSADDEPIRVFVDDTVAGLATKMRTSIFRPRATINFQIVKPDGAILQIPARANEMGVAETELAGFHTKNAGVFEVRAAGENLPFDDSPAAVFRVFPAEVSISKSQVFADPSSIFANGNERALLKISLQDEYENPISQKSAIVISSRSTDEIRATGESSLSDKNGNLFFEISSNEPGIAHFTVIEKASGATLQQRAKIIFVDPAPPSAENSSENLGTNPANFLGANLFGDFSMPARKNFSADLFDDLNSSESNETFGPIDHFEIDFPEKVAVGSDQNFLKISAKDSQNRTVKDYTGVAIISVPDDENATLPGDGRYNFTERDQGEHTFDLALIFSKTGSQKIQVFDFDPDTGAISQTISGEKTIEVSAEKIDVSQTSGKNLEIKKPTDGATLTSSNLIVVGKGDPNTNLEIFIDEIKMAEAELDSDGLFTKEIQNLSDGAHEMFLQDSMNADAKSAKIDFSISTKLPTLDEFTISPNGAVKPRTQITATVKSSPDLTVNFSAGSIFKKMTESSNEPGKYSVTFSAPENAGEFSISVNLTNEFGKKLEKKNVGVLKILPAEKPLPVPIGVVAESLDAGAEISWEKVDDSRVVKILIFGGTDRSNLRKLETAPAGKTSAKVANLQNGEKYYFAISTADSAGKQSEKSALAVAIPAALHGSANEFVATAGENKIFLRWTPVGGVYFWEISLSVDGVNFQTIQNLPSSAASAVVENLIAGQKYFFRLVPKNINGIFTGDIFPQIESTPLWGNSAANLTPTFIENYSPPSHVANGPVRENLILSSFIFAAAAFFLRRFLVLRI
jgi:hypothetical protein